MAMRIIHITPAHERMSAVFAKEDGAPEFRPVVAWACMEHEDSGTRCVAGIAVGKHPEPADFDPAFVGYTRDEMPTPWAEACKERRAWVENEKKKAAGQKIIVPQKPTGIVFPGQN